MATRSAIGYRQKSGAVRAVYVHYDGYPEHQLPILRKRYNTLRKVQALIRPGSMSSLRTRSTWDHGGEIMKDAIGEPLRDIEGYLMSKNDRAPQPLYHFERGDTDCGPSVSHYPRNFWFHKHDCEHLYVFEPSTNEWTHISANDPFNA